ncbi:hypothetical protein ACEPPN_009903 [Leptodophora sp. 'Broadleaf-Isolate-01']
MAPRPVGSDALGLSSVPGLAVYCRCPLKKQSEGRESFVSVQRDKDQEIVCKARERRTSAKGILEAGGALPILMPYEWEPEIQLPDAVANAGTEVPIILSVIHLCDPAEG